MRSAYLVCAALLVALSGAGCSCIVSPDETRLGPFADASADADVDADEDSGADAGPDAEPDAGPDACTEASEERCNGLDDDCDGNIDEGIDNLCGSCDETCAVPGGTGSCVAGECEIICDPDALDCNDEPGCETPVSNDNCGCGRPCTGEEICDTTGGDPTCRSGCEGMVCDGVCVDTQTDPSHCGACGEACVDPPNAGGLCEDSSCRIGACESGFDNCDGDDTNGCETDTDDDVANCGACGTMCSFANATAACEASACEIDACQDGFADCDGVSANGCEVSLDSNAACGSCGEVCEAGPGALAACEESSCSYRCDAGRLDCNGGGAATDADGCEVDGQMDTANCGECGRSCPAGSMCVDGGCTSIVCGAGTANCDGDDDNGCEVSTDDDIENCGGCAIPCRAANATSTCTGGVCEFMCRERTADCDGEESNGCETRLGQVSSCSGCGDVCAFPNAVPACQAQTCELVGCVGGFGDCNNNSADGCETDTRTSTTHCGGCSNVCAFPNASSSCANGSCEMGACDDGFADCDGSAANGCEAALANDPLNCGSCGDLCSDPGNGSATCAASSCTLTCDPGFTLCGTECVDTNTSASHCGECDRMCVAPMGTCDGGSCVGSMELCNRVDDTANSLVDETLISSLGAPDVGTPTATTWDYVRGDHAVGSHRFGVVYRRANSLRTRSFDASSNSWSPEINLNADARGFDICAISIGWVVVRTGGNQVQSRLIPYSGPLFPWVTHPAPAALGGPVSDNWNDPNRIRCEGFTARGSRQVVVVVEADTSGGNENLFAAVAADPPMAGPPATFTTLVQNTSGGFIGHDIAATANGYALGYIRQPTGSLRRPAVGIVDGASGDLTSVTRTHPIGTGRSNATSTQIIYVPGADRVVMSWFEDLPIARLGLRTVS